MIFILGWYITNTKYICIEKRAIHENYVHDSWGFCQNANTTLGCTMQTTQKPEKMRFVRPHYQFITQGSENLFENLFVMGISAIYFLVRVWATNLWRSWMYGMEHVIKIWAQMGGPPWINVEWEPGYSWPQNVKTGNQHRSRRTSRNSSSQNKTRDQCPVSGATPLDVMCFNHK